MEISQRALFFFFLFTFSVNFSRGQEVYLPLNNSDVYEFMDELANAGLIEINTAVKPYPRTFISKKLMEADMLRASLNRRQQAQLDFYRIVFSIEAGLGKTDGHGRDFLHHQDSLFTCAMNPVLGGQFYSNRNEAIYKYWYGTDAFSYIGRKLGCYAGIRNTIENSMLSSPHYLNLADAYVYKQDGKGGGSCLEIHGGITYTWRRGSIGLIRDHFEWGDNAHGSNLFSGRQPAFPFVNLHLKPFRFCDVQYIHGWLASGLVDSARTYSSGNFGVPVYLPKYISANLFTLYGGRKFQAFLGNSIVYTDRHVQLPYLVPLLSVFGVQPLAQQDGSSAVVNSQIFFGLSSRHVNHLHLYMNVYADGFRNGKLIHSNRFGKENSVKIGARLSNPGNSNLFFTAEFTRTLPRVYKGTDSLVSFSSSEFNMGHYLGDDAKEVYLHAGFRPLMKIYLETSWTWIQKKDNNESAMDSKDPVNVSAQDFAWEGTDVSLLCRYLLFRDAWVFAACTLGEHHGPGVQQYMLPSRVGRNTTISLGARFGF